MCVQAFNVLATPIRQAKSASYQTNSRVLDINHVDVDICTVLSLSVCLSSCSLVLYCTFLLCIIIIVNFLEVLLVRALRSMAVSIASLRVRCCDVLPSDG